MRHPVELAIEYRDRQLNRLSTLFRPFVAIPSLIVVGAVSGGSFYAFVLVTDAYPPFSLAP